MAFVQPRGVATFAFMHLLRSFAPVPAILVALVSLAPAAPPDARPTTASAETARTSGFAVLAERAENLAPLHTIIVGVDGRVKLEKGFRGFSTDRSANIKSASKSVISALVGIAIEKGAIRGIEQPIADFLSDRFPANPDPRLFRVTVGDLLSMRAGLERTSGPNYGAWIASPNWVRDALSRPFVAEPGGEMLYSTGSTHLLSAILTKATGRSTLALARDWLGPAGVAVAAWERDPQGIYLGGNQMAMTPKSLFRFGELYRRGGHAADGRPVVPEPWVRASWEKRTTTRWSGDDYGYGWFGTRLAGHDVHYGWGYGGQMIYVVPDLGLTVAITSDTDSPSARSGYKEELHRLVAEAAIPAALAERATATEPAASDVLLATGG